MIADSSREAARLEVTSFFFHFGVLVVLFDNASQFKRTEAYYFEIGAALQARNDFTFVEFFFFDIKITFTCRAQNHNRLPIAFFFPDGTFPITVRENRAPSRLYI